MGATSDRRPVVVLNIVYRLRSACRAREIQAWLIQTGVLRSGYGAGAETLAVEFAMQIQQASWPGQEFDGLVQVL